MHLDDDAARLTQLAWNSIAISTQRGYQRALKPFIGFCEEKSLQPFPASEKTIQSFFIHCMEKKKSPSTVATVFSAISTVHEIFGLLPPRVNARLGRAQRGWQREQAQPSKRKLPFTPSIYRMLFDVFIREAWEGNKEPNLIYWRTMWRILIGHFAGLRWSETTGLRYSDIKHEGNFLELVIKKRKNDQLQKGAIRKLVSTPELGPLCPVAFTETYARLLGYDECSNGFMQPQFQVIRSASAINRIVVPKTQEKLNYNTSRSNLRNVLSKIGLNPDLYGEHSPKIGAITLAAARGASRSELTVAGGWVTDAMCETYIRDSDQMFTNLSQRLSLANTNPTAYFSIPS